jgi:hypothetical protein
MRLGIGLVLFASLAFGCSEDAEGQPGTGGSGGGGSGGGGTGGTGGGGEAGSNGAASVTLSGTVVEASAGSLGSETPLDGAEVCVVDASQTKNPSIPCVTSNSAGQYALAGLTPDTRLIATFEKTGYNTQAIAIDVGAANATRAALRMPLSAQSPTDFGTDPSVTQDLTTKGLLNVVAVTPAAIPDAGTGPGPALDFTTGVSFSISPAGGDGPFYNDDSEQFVSGATATAGGWGAWFLNLEPGEVVITATHATLNCNSVADNGYGWPEPDGKLRDPILTGILTQAVAFFCAPPTDGGT